jgi:hypothetical protein
MRDKPEDEKIKKRIELFDRYHNAPDQYHKIFTELGFSFMVDECDGNCPDCKDKGTCEVFLKIKDDEEN